ncbi:cytochrome c3 family protein [Desulfobacterales bacterium HSG17]|nr:cytochrome c3 family protein [Desulfobacterales bacterium HSG17]
MIRNIAMICTLLLFVLVEISTSAEQNQGAENISIFGGTTGDIQFPHRTHQNSLKDCTVCHSNFPQTTGILWQLKEDGDLRSKKIMNTLCMKCHRQMKKAGDTTGPTRCKGCHQK